MKTNSESKFSYLLIGLGLGAIGGLMSALLARKETRELVSHRCDSINATTEAENQAYQEERREHLGG
jgi:gas vesicle protein